MPIKLKKVNFKEASKEIKGAVERGAVASGQKKNKTRDGVIIVLGLIMFTLVLGGFGYNKFKLGRASLTWPAVEGEITVSHVVKDRRDSKDYYTPVVNYKYRVGETEYIGSRIAADSLRTTHSYRTTKILEDFPMGARVPVYYSPENPENTILIPGVQKMTYYLLAAAAACLFFAVMVLISLIKNVKGQVNSGQE